MTSRPARSLQLWLAAALLLAPLLLASTGHAQTYGVGTSGPAFGNVASAASGDTTFTIDASTGSVSKSGNGARISTGSANATITISCGNVNSCNTSTVKLKVGSNGAISGRTKAITAFTVASGTGTVSSVSGTNPITFNMTAIGKNSSKTFKLGMTFAVEADNSGHAVGAATSGYYVSAVASPSTPPSSGTNGALTATVFRSMSIAKNSDLSFGRIVRPVSGNGSVSLAAANNGRTSSGVVWLTTPASTRASYTVTGEGGKAISVSVPTTFIMQNLAGDTITVTTNNNVAVSPTLSSIAGQTGTYSFFVGGGFPVNSTTASGAYTGTFTVTASYN